MPTGYRLLVRSAPHPFYDPRGGAQNAGYGTGRRSLTGIERCVEVLRREGIDASTYEPGAHDVFCQARTFAAARGIIAIRGAEFANAFWMKPDALLVMVNHEPGGSPPQRGLAKLLGLVHYTEIDAPPSTPLVLDPGTVVPLVQQHLAGLSPKFAF
jgi:hypothetical protein